MSEISASTGVAGARSFLFDPPAGIAARQPANVAWSPPASRVQLKLKGASSSKAVCLLSGGLDSSTCLALARREGYACYALSFDYGQRHKFELEAAARVAAALGVERHLVAQDRRSTRSAARR